MPILNTEKIDKRPINNLIMGQIQKKNPENPPKINIFSEITSFRARKHFLKAYSRQKD